MIEAVNKTADIWFGYVLSAAIQSTVLGVATLALVRVGRRWSPAFRQALLLIALLKFAVPPQLSLPTRMFSHLGPYFPPASRVVQLAPMMGNTLWIAEPFEPSPAPEGNLVREEDGRRLIAVEDLSRTHGGTAPRDVNHFLILKSGLMIVHLLGSIFVLVAVLLQMARLNSIVCRSAPATGSQLLETYADLCSRMKVSRRPMLLLSRTNHSPMAFGTWKPFVLLPQGLTDVLGPTEIRVILAHELAHHLRRDLWLNWLQVPISALWWFNPVYWVVWRHIRCIREDCCDDVVMASGLSTGEAYCLTLLAAARVASGDALPGASFGYISESQPLFRRFRRIMSAGSKPNPKLALRGLLAVAALGLVCLPGIEPRSRLGPRTAPASSETLVYPYATPVGLTSPAGEKDDGGIDVRIPLSKGFVVSGWIRDTEGSPIRGAVVSAEGGPQGMIRWYAQTDSAGHFEWNCAPAQSLSYRVRAAGFIGKDALVLEHSKEHEIRLRKLSSIQITGRVVDSKTGRPLDDFRVLISSNCVMDHWIGFRVAARGENGAFALSLQDAWPRYGLRIEADGYFPDTSESVQIKDGSRMMKIELVRGMGLSGVVLLPDGTAAGDAEVSLFAAKSGVVVAGPAVSQYGIAVMNSSGRMTGSGLAQPTATVFTNASGRFYFSPTDAPHTIIVTNESGFAKLSAEQLAASPIVTLEPWGRIEGVLFIGRKPGAHETVALSSLYISSRPPRFSVQLTAETDRSGRFAFPCVPAGEYRVVRILNGQATSSISRILQTQFTPVRVRPGSTQSVKVGGIGSPVTGRIVVTGADAGVNWIHNFARLELKLPDLAFSGPQDASAYARSFYETEEGRSRLRSQRIYDFAIASDGTFRIEDVPPGTYNLIFTIGRPRQNYDRSLPISPYVSRHELGTVTREVTIPDIPGTRNSEAFDIGTVRMETER